MKRPIGVILACTLILTLGLAAWAAKPAQPTAQTTTKVTGGGWYTDELTSPGHHCSFGFQARGPAVGTGSQPWSGEVTFTDRDNPTGLVKAKLTVDTATYIADYDLMLTGTATVYVNDAFQGTYQFQFELFDAATGGWPADRVVCILSGFGYYSKGDLGGGQVKYH